MWRQRKSSLLLLCSIQSPLLLQLSPHSSFSSNTSQTSLGLQHNIRQTENRTQNTEREMGQVRRFVSLVLLFSFSALFPSSKALEFKCSTPSGSICHSLVNYIPPVETTYDEVLNLFNIKNLRSVLGANNLPSTITRSAYIKAKQSLKIPISCHCSNGTGTLLFLLLCCVGKQKMFNSCFIWLLKKMRENPFVRHSLERGFISYSFLFE